MYVKINYYVNERMLTRNVRNVQRRLRKDYDSHLLKGTKRTHYMSNNIEFSSVLYTVANSTDYLHLRYGFKYNLRYHVQ